MKCWQKGSSVAWGKTSSSCIILFPVYLKRRIYLHFLLNLFVINKFRFLSQNFLVRKRWVHKTASSTWIHGVVNNPLSTKLNYSKLKNAVLNPSKSFLASKKVSPRILLTFKRLFSEKMEKTPSSHIIHSPGGESCWIVRDCEPIRLLKSPRSLSVYKLISDVLVQ